MKDGFPVFRPLKGFLPFAVMAGLCSCAQPALDIAEPSARHEAAVAGVLESSPSPSRELARAEMTPAVNRVLPRVRRSAHRICVGLELPEERCRLMGTARVSVYTDSPRINAYADHRDEVGMFGGLVGRMGTDGEIAAVLAHEFAHVMYGHVRKKTGNALVGAGVAGGIMAGLAAASGAALDPDVYEQWMEIGAGIGSRAYSPAMEIEADRTAIYILKGAGFPPDAMRDSIVRITRMDLRAEVRAVGGTGKVGWLETHPSDDRRIAHILAAIEDAGSGVPLRRR